ILQKKRRNKYSLLGTLVTLGQENSHVFLEIAENKMAKGKRARKLKKKQSKAIDVSDVERMREKMEQERSQGGPLETRPNDSLFFEDRTATKGFSLTSNLI